MGQEYLEAEETSEVKHEYVAVVIYARLGGRARHSRIAGNG